MRDTIKENRPVAERNHVGTGYGIPFGLGDFHFFGIPRITLNKFVCMCRDAIVCLCFACLFAGCLSSWDADEGPDGRFQSMTFVADEGITVSGLNPPKDRAVFLAKKMRTPERFVMTDVTVIEAVDKLMEWYKEGLTPFERDISFVIFPLPEDNKAPISGNGTSFLDQPPERKRGTVDLSGLTMGEAFEKIAKTFRGKAFFRHGVFYIGSEEAFDRNRHDQLADRGSSVPVSDTDRCDGWTLFRATYRIVAPHTVCVTVKNISKRDCLILMGKGHPISYTVDQDSGNGRASRLEDIVLFPERQRAAGRIPLAGNTVDRTDSISDSFSFTIGLPLHAAFIRSIRFDMHVIPDVDIWGKSPDNATRAFKSVSVTVAHPTGE